MATASNTQQAAESNSRKTASQRRSNNRHQKRHDKRTTHLEFQQAMHDFKTMFPDIDSDVIETVLRANKGAVDSTVDHLLAISVDVDDTDIQLDPLIETNAESSAIQSGTEMPTNSSLPDEEAPPPYTNDSAGLFSVPVRGTPVGEERSTLEPDVTSDGSSSSGGEPHVQACSNQNDDPLPPEVFEPLSDDDEPPPAYTPRYDRSWAGAMQPQPATDSNAPNLLLFNEQPSSTAFPSDRTSAVTSSQSRPTDKSCNPVTTSAASALIRKTNYSHNISNTFGETRKSPLSSSLSSTAYVGRGHAETLSAETWSFPSTALRVSGPAVTSNSPNINAFIPLTTSFSTSLCISSNSAISGVQQVQTPLAVKHRQGVLPRPNIRTNPSYSYGFGDSVPTLPFNDTQYQQSPNDSCGDVRGAALRVTPPMSVHFPPAHISPSQTGARPKQPNNCVNIRAECVPKSTSSAPVQVKQPTKSVHKGNVKISHPVSNTSRPTTVHNAMYEDSSYTLAQARHKWNPALIGPLPSDFLRLFPARKSSKAAAQGKRCNVNRSSSLKNENTTQHTHSRHKHVVRRNQSITASDFSSTMLKRQMEENQLRQEQAEREDNFELKQILEDERIALCMQNQEFLEELRHNKEFMKQLENSNGKNDNNLKAGSNRNNALPSRSIQSVSSSTRFPNNMASASMITSQSVTVDANVDSTGQLLVNPPVDTVNSYFISDQLEPKVEILLDHDAFPDGMPLPKDEDAEFRAKLENMDNPTRSMFVRMARLFSAKKRKKKGHVINAASTANLLEEEEQSGDAAEKEEEENDEEVPIIEPLIGFKCPFTVQKPGNHDT